MNKEIDYIIPLRRIAKTRKQIERRRKMIMVRVIVLLAAALTALSIRIYSSEPKAPPEPPTTAAPIIIPTVKTTAVPDRYEQTAAPIVTEALAKYPLTPEQRELLAVVAFTEAGIDGIEGMTAALFVVRNRLEDGRFGDTLEDICVPDQFHGLRRQDLAEQVTEDAYEAVEAVFDERQADTTNGALYFCSGDPDAIKPGLIEVAHIGRHQFYTDLVEEG